MSARLLELQRVQQARGDLAIGEFLPFRPARFFLVHDIPKGVKRGGHAHRELEQILVAVAGSVLVETHDGKQDAAFLLEEPWQALYVPPMVWTEQSFTANARLLVLASMPYQEAEYIRERAEFDRLTKRAA